MFRLTPWRPGGVRWFLSSILHLPLVATTLWAQSTTIVLRVIQDPAASSFQEPSSTSATWN
jgi:hypothetical protein